MKSVLVPVIKGFCVVAFIASTTDLHMSNPEWWVAMVALNVIANN